MWYYDMFVFIMYRWWYSVLFRTLLFNDPHSVLWFGSLSLAHSILITLAGVGGGEYTHTHTFFFILIWPLLHFPLPFSLSPSLSKFSQPFSIFFTLFWLSFPFSSSMELKHKGLALVKFTLKRIPPPSWPQPLCHYTIPITLLFLHMNETRQKAHVVLQIALQL